jgi:hypothetical protein
MAKSETQTVALLLREYAQRNLRSCDLKMRDIPFYLQDFVDRYEGRYRDFQLPLPIRLV